ncbi:MAG: GTP 3',8-cyclase MoaA [bacterium]
MFDSNNRCINYMRISITDRCNLRCRYCMSHTNITHLPHEEILSFEEIICLVSIGMRIGISKVRITGGEPLVRKGVIDLISGLSALEGLQDISLTTNGVLLSEYADSLLKAGIKRLNISLDTLDREKYHYISGKDCLMHIWEGIRKAEELGISPIKINMVVINGFNDDEVLNMAKLTLDRALWVRFIEYMPLGDHDFWSKERIIPNSTVKNMISEYASLIPLDSAKHNVLNQRYRFEHGKGEIGFISPISNCFCKTCNRIRVTADGRLRNCLFHDQEIDIKMPMRAGASDEELRAILEKSIKSKPMKHRLLEDVSHKCKRSMWNIGG